MSQPVRELARLLQSMQPTLHAGTYVYCAVQEGTQWQPLDPVAMFREVEGITLVLPEQQAVDAGLSILFRAAWITLEVHSDLLAIGLTAAVATALTAAGIPCNVIAGAYHDHVFVPVDSAHAAVDALCRLQERGA